MLQFQFREIEMPILVQRKLIGFTLLLSICVLQLCSCASNDRGTGDSVASGGNIAAGGSTATGGTTVICGWVMAGCLPPDVSIGMELCPAERDCYIQHAGCTQITCMRPLATDDGGLDGGD